MNNQFNAQEVARNIKTLPPSCQKLTTGMQQRWNRAIPESDYIQLGTLRYGVRLSNPNLANAATANDDNNGIPLANSRNTQQSRISSDSYDQHTNGSSVLSAGGTSSNSSRGVNDSCCCIGSNGIEMPWSGGYVRTRLPVPSNYAKNRKSSPSTSTSSSSSSTTHRQLHQAPQKQTATQQGSREKLQHSTNNGTDLLNNCSNNNNNGSSTFAGVDKHNQQRESSPASVSGVCCYTSNNFSSASNKNAKNNNLVKVSNKYSDSKKLKIVNNKGEHKDTVSSSYDEENRTSGNHRNGFGYGSNSRNLSEKWSSGISGEYDAVTSSVQKHGDFPSSEIISAKEPLGRGSEVSVKKNDGDDLNLNFRNAQPQSKEPRLKDVNINNFKKRNTSTYGVYFGPNSSVGRTGINNKNNIGKNTTTRGDDICTDELSSSSSLSPRSPPSPLPLPPPPTVVAESWMFNDRVKQTPPCSPIPTSCSGSFNKISSPFETTARSESSPFDFSPPGTPQHTRVRAFSDSNGCSAENNQCRINRPAVQHHNKLTTKNHTIPPSENERAYDQRKSSLPVINHASVVRSQPYRKFSSDIISAKANGPPSSVVICQLTPKLASRGSNAEVRLQSLSRYCAQNLNSNPISDSPAVAESEDFTFIDSSDISSTGDDVITVINEEDYREYHKYLSIPKLDGSSDGLCPSGYDSCQNSNSNYGYGCSSDELSSVCSGSDSVPTLVVNNFKEEAKRNFHTVKYKQCNVSLQSSARASGENHPGSSCPGPSSPVDSEQKSPTAVSGQSDSNNNQHMRNTEDELKFNPSNNSHDRNEDRLSGVAAAAESVGQNSTHRLGFNSISPDSSSSSLNCFGKHQLHVRSSPEKPIMEKKNYALDRLQKLVKKTTSGSSEGKTSDKQGGTKTERLRELTELLKGTRNPPVPPPRRPKASQSLDKTFERQNTTSLTSASLLNIDTLRGENNSSNLVKSKESRSIDFPYQFVEGNRASTPSSPRSEHKANLRANVSTSNLESLQSSPTKENNVSVVEIPSTDFKEDDDIFTKLSRPESRTIVGSYTQKTIPFRSASFSQVDYSSGKYIRSALGAIKNSLMRGKEGPAVDSVTLPRNKKEFTRSCSPAQLSSASEPCGSFEENVTSKGSLKKSELSINLSPPDGFERIEGFDGKELSSNRNSDIETIVEDPEAEHSETIENENSIQKKAEINAVQASEMILEPLVEEGIPITPQSLAKDEECLQQATTCLIPVPVYDCVVSEWSTARPSEQWIDASMTECTKLTECLDSIIESSENASEPSEVHLNPVEAIVIDSPPDVLEVEMSKLGTVDETAEQFVELALNSTINSNQFENGEMCTPPVSIICTEPDSEVSTTIIETPPTPEEALIRVESVEGEVVEVRKRHSNNEDSGEAISNCNSEMEEKRRIDKSKRRKGIYIQWPAIDTNLDPESDSNDNCTPDDSWRPSRLTIEKDSSIDLSGESCTDLSSKDITSSPEKLRDSSIYHGPDPFLLGPNTPDSDISRPEWPRGLRRKSLTYQSSDEKDDSAPISSIPVRSFKNIFLRSDSVSDNESERASSRDRTSASPAPSSEHDLRRYSKRPLRGPYGQMLEAEMKKPSKVHYNEILEELARHESSHSFPSASRNRGSGSQSMDETNDRHSSKLFKPRKASANLPLPSHSRTASSPSKLADLGAETSPSSKRHLGNIEQRSTDSDKSEKAPCKLENKKFSLDSHLSDKTAHHHEKHSKRSSGNCDKHQKRSLDDTRYSQASRTPSERSFTIGTPDKPKSLVASPELLAELLKGSSEKLVTEQLTGGASPNNNASNALPTAVLKCLDTRTHVVVELFNTEKSYVESLQTIVLKYLNQLKSPENAGLVDTQTVDEIFFMVPAILNIHERFLEELRRRLDAWDPMQKIGDAFVDVFSRPVILDTYTSFVNNWNRAKDAIRTTRQKCPAFARFLEAMAREHKGKLSLDNLLIKPVQKFPNYELILSRLIKHTDTDHPDQKPLQEALKLVHDILMFLNCKEKEALENGQRETALRELEGVIEGMNDLVTPDRAFLLFDLVSMPSGQATRKERGFFLFNDLLVITSIKRRSGTIRKTNMTCPGSVASTLDTNKYKFLTKISLDDLEIVKSKDENIRRIMKEIEHLSDDSNKLTQIFDLAASLRCPHQLLEESIRDLQREVQRQLSERQTNDAQLNILELMLNSSGGIQNMTVLFSKPDKRAQWEEAFTEAKQKLASALERCQIPEFVVSVPIRKTRAGLQFTCASPTLGIQRDVWVCNSDGYVGQVCVLSLVPEPTVTSCNGVCNARILCVASVPASDDSSSSHANASINISIQEPPTSVANAINSIVNSKPREKRKPTDGSSTESRNSCNIQLDSDSSSDDSETESQPERAVSPSNSTTATSSLTSSSLPISHRHQESNSEETDALQSTMWLGTEDGCIHVYNCTDNIRIKKNKIKIPHISAVYSILYLSNKVFVSLANGDVCIYSRDHNGWNTTSPFTVTVGTVTSPVTKLLNVHSKLWCAIQGCIKVLNTTTLQVDSQIQISNDSKPITNMTVLDEYVWISVQNSAHIKCCHHESYEIIFEVNLAPSVNKMLSNCDDIIRQHKAACLRVTSLLACKDLIWVGTSAGVLLTIAGSNISKGSSPPAVTGIPHGHTGHVRFLTFVESPQCDSSDDLSKLSDSKTDIVKTSTNRTLLVISGGDGYEDFRSSGNNTMSEIAGREDSTNHLLLWHV